jgi:hypothetical protein
MHINMESTRPLHRKLYTLSADEVEALASPEKFLHRVFFGVCLGVLISFGIALATLTIDNARIHASFVGLAGASALLAIYFGGRVLLDNKKVREIKAGK